MKEALRRLQALESKLFSPLFRYLVRHLAPAMMAFAFSWGAVGHAAASETASTAQSEAHRPNIIYILADDMGYGDVGFMGQERIQTPEMDRLAAEGMVFTQHYAGSTICTPSRAALMTGMHTGRVHADRNDVNRTIQPQEKTVAEVLQEAGYRTHFVGKWGLGGAAMPDDPYVAESHWEMGPGTLIPEQVHAIPSNRGFHTSLAYLNQVYAHLYFPMYLWREDQKMLIPGNQSPRYEERKVYSHDLFEEETLRILREADGDAPLYLQLSYTIPHRETKAPPCFNPYNDTDWPEVEQAYAAMITYLDATVGRILDTVAENPQLAENTLIILTSDNGGQHTDGHSAYFFESGGPLRGHKRDLYEGGIRVPTAIHWGGVIDPGSTTDHVSTFWDFLPTAAELAGTAVLGGLDGISFAPTLTGEGDQPAHDLLYWVFYEGVGGPAPDGGIHTPQRVAVRQGAWKLLVLANDTVELYNLKTDPGETQNLADEEPERLQTLLSRAKEETLRRPEGPDPMIRELSVFDDVSPPWPDADNPTE